MISAIMLLVLKNSLLTSLLIGLLLLLVPLLQKRYRAKWRYVAWIVIAVKLLLPVNLSLPQAPIYIELPEQRTIATVTPPSDERPFVELFIPKEIANTPAPVVNNAEADVDFPNTIAISPLTIAGGVWFIGVLAFLLFQIASYQTFLRKLKTSHIQETPQPIKETIWRLGVDMGIGKLPEPVVTDAIDAPVLIGVLRPRILLPHTKYTDEEIAFILRHELVHYRRRDMWYKLVLLLANALHWFNPLVYIMTVQAAKDIELACDDDVIHGLDQATRARYGDTILSALPRKRRLEPVFSTHFGSTKQNMQYRLRNLFDMAAKRRGIAALCAVIVCALTLTSFATIGYAATKSDVIAEPEQTAQLPKISQTEASSLPTAPSPANFSIQRLGRHTIQNVDTLKINLKWSGKGNVMLLYTDRDYTDDEILVPLQGIQGLPKPNYDNANQEKVSGVFNFSASPTSPLLQQNRVAKSGPYYFYIVQYGFDTLNKLTGEVSRIDADGDIYGIWGLHSEAVNPVQVKPPVSLEDKPAFQIKSNGAKSVTKSGSFEAKAGQKLILVADSNIKGGSVDFFLFSPSGKEQRFTIGGSATIKTIELSAGRWAYNCTGFFDSGDIVITGNKITNGVQAKSTAADKAAYEVMQYSRSWMMAEYMLPYMTKDGIDSVVKLNNELNPSDKKSASDYYSLATPSKTESNQRSYALMEKSGNWKYSSPLFPYMTNEGINRVVALYNQKTGKNVKAADYYN